MQLVDVGHRRCTRAPRPASRPPSRTSPRCPPSSNCSPTGPTTGAARARCPRTPDLLARAWDCDWSAGVEPLRERGEPVRGRPRLRSRESRRKPRSSSRRPAACMRRRSAPPRCKHGPMALVRAGFPVLMFTQNDDTRAGIEELARGVRRARCARAARGRAGARRAISLPVVAAHPVIEPLLAIQSFYRARGRRWRARAGSIPTGRRTSTRSPRPSDARRRSRNGRDAAPTRVRDGRTLLVRDGRVEAVVGAEPASCGADRIVDLEGQTLVPGFIDTQVNGGGGVLFNDDPSVASIAPSARRTGGSAPPVSCPR